MSKSNSFLNSLYENDVILQMVKTEYFYCFSINETLFYRKKHLIENLQLPVLIEMRGLSTIRLKELFQKMFVEKF